jgi:hypothetical protein
MRVLLLVCLVGCGARTDLEVAELAFDAGPDASAECSRDRDCDDALDCTRDRCTRGRCETRPRDGRCADTTCTVGRCDPALGCVADPIGCSDGVACTVDTCSEESGCASTPDDALCPISNRCDPERGCIARALVHDSFALYEVELPSGELRRLTRTGATFTDIALAPDRELYGVSRTQLFGLTDDSARVRTLGTSDSWVALDVGPDGLLYAAGENERVVAIDLATLDSRVVATLPPPFVASGDIAFVEGRMLITVTDAPSSRRDDTRLAEIDLASGTARVLGRTGRPCIWALAAFGPQLYGFTCEGILLRIDPFSGEADLVRTLGIDIGGAAAR